MQQLAPLTQDQTTLILSAAQKLSDMADKVAGFAISADLLLVFACLKDIPQWIENKLSSFEIGTLIAGLFYIGAVWFLYMKESGLRATAGPLPPAVQTVSGLLVWARTVGITMFTLVAMLAVLGGSRGPHR